MDETMSNDVDTFCVLFCVSLNYSFVLLCVVDVKGPKLSFKILGNFPLLKPASIASNRHEKD